MRVLVTGAAGFVGRHLIRELSESGHAPIALDVNFPGPLPGVEKAVAADLLDAAALDRAAAETRPEACIHLGAISSVPAGRADPALMFSVNVLGTVNLLNALRKAGTDPKTLVVSTSHIYGSGQGAKPLSEDAPIAPNSIYAASKAAADLATLAYAKEYGLPAMTARPSNHTGPGQSTQFAVAALCSQIRAMAGGAAGPVLDVGNLDSERDFMDARDVARAYRLLIEKGRAGHAYNISSLRKLKIRMVMEKACELAGVRPEIRVNPAKFRPTDTCAVLDISRLRSHTGWTAEIPLEQTLRDMLAPDASSNVKRKRP